MRGVRVVCWIAIVLALVAYISVLEFRIWRLNATIGLDSSSFSPGFLTISRDGSIIRAQLEMSRRRT